MRYFILALGTLLSLSSYAGPHYVGGQVTSLKGNATEPAIRLQGNVSPSDCDGGRYGWLYFSGTSQERQWLYSTAMAMALSGKSIAVYTNSDGEKCRIRDIQITSGLN